MRKTYPIVAIDKESIQIKDKFWKPRIETNRSVTIPDNFSKCEEGRIDNFRLAAGMIEGEFKGLAYDDSDVFKVMEAAAHSLSAYPDPQLEEYMDDLIAIISEAQEKDGYLYTIRSTKSNLSNKDFAGKTRWSNLMMSHELYNMGHMYEAAVAYKRATGKASLLDVAEKNFRLIQNIFGPEETQLHNPPGHQEIELALIKLYQLTEKEEYLQLARYFLDVRGRGKLYKRYAPPGFRSILQNHKPVLEQKEAVGHSVRALYQYASMADIAALMKDGEYKKAASALWNDIVAHKMAITGGLGARRDYERFARKYHLPNSTSYNETCASIAMILFTHRMFMLTGESKFIDILERELYNGFLVGVNLGGNKYFYPNVLHSDGIYPFNQNESASRNPWFSTSCCPSNIARLFPQIGNYISACDNNKFYLNLFVGGSIEHNMDGELIALEIETNYPWDGKIHIRFVSSFKKDIALRIPGWVFGKPVPSDLYTYRTNAPNKFLLSINGEEAEYRMQDGYAVLSKDWVSGDLIVLDLPMPIRQVLSHPRVKANRNKIAIERGPLLYCAEGADNDDSVLDLVLDAALNQDDFSISRENIENHEFIKIKLDAWRRKKAFLESWRSKKSRNKKYRYNTIPIFTSLREKIHARASRNEKLMEKTAMTMIPYYLWSNRGENEMLVWFPYRKLS